MSAHLNDVDGASPTSTLRSFCEMFAFKFCGSATRIFSSRIRKARARSNPPARTSCTSGPIPWTEMRNKMRANACKTGRLRAAYGIPNVVFCFPHG
jgi:hypothetical protein